MLLQDARKLDFPGKFDAVWLGPYHIREVFPTNSVQLETLNVESFPNRCRDLLLKQLQRLISVTKMTTRPARRQQVGGEIEEAFFAKVVKRSGSRSEDEGTTRGGETTEPRAEDRETKGILPARERELRD